MTTSGTTAPPPSPPAPSPPAATGARRLRRSRSDRVGAGVAAGLARYFDVDPVLFRVLFAVSAFFGGAGVIAYLVAWAAIPEDGTDHAMLDGWIGELRRRHVSPWLVAIVAGLALWAAAFSWWTPAPFWPVLLVVVVLVVLYGRRSAGSSTGASPGAPSAGPSPATTTVNLTKQTAAQPGDETTADAPKPAWGEASAWLEERRAAARTRRRRAFPVRIATLLAVAAALIVLAIVDAVHGIALPLYFVFAGAIALAGLLVGLIARRTPWSVLGLVVVSLVGLAAFGATRASLHDGVGVHTWNPQTKPAASYRLAFGKGTLDLRDLSTQDVPRTVRVTAGAGQVRVIAPKSMNLTISANVHAGNVAVDLPASQLREGDGGFDYNRIVRPPAGASGPPIKVIVHLADGNIDVQRR